MADGDDGNITGVKYSRLRDKLLVTRLKFRLETLEWVYEEYDLE